MKIIVEAGGTKCKWGLIDSTIRTIETIGFNPNCGRIDGLRGIANAIGEVVGFDAESVLYFGAGCGNKQNQENVKKTLQEVFTGAKIKICSDLEGAAMALFDNKTGIAAILGTGAAAGIFDGEKIVVQAPSLGYILGDEGSGAYLGKILIQKILRNEVSANLCTDFWNTTNTTAPDLIHDIYSSDAINSKFASFVPFISKNIDNEEIAAIVIEGFDKFYEKHIKPLNNSKLPIGFVGGIAFQFSNLLKQQFENKGFNITILKDAYSKLITMVH